MEDLINPMRYCTVSMSDNECPHNDRCKRKYECTYCLKTFGWSTDLKRHILTHTGERPFKCGLCDSTFTRKFLLQKHHEKQHVDVHLLGKKIKIPLLKPIGFMLKRKAQKQDKQKIQRKVLNAKSLYQSVSERFEVAKSLVCST